MSDLHARLSAVDPDRHALINDLQDKAARESDRGLDLCAKRERMIGQVARLKDNHKKSSVVAGQLYDLTHSMLRKPKT